MRLWLFVLLSIEAQAAVVSVAPVRFQAQVPALQLSASPIHSGTLSLQPLMTPALAPSLSLQPSQALTAAPSVEAQAQAAEPVSAMESLQTQVQLPAAEAGLAFDGAGNRRDGDKLGPQAPELPAYLSVADEDHRYSIAAIVEAAQRSATGRRVLKSVAAMAAKRGRPVIIAVEPLRTTNGEYVYDWEVVKMGSAYLRKDPGLAAHTLVHELLHVVQKEMGLPVDALEMELEAHVVGLKVISELGLKPEKGSFERLVALHLRPGAAVDLPTWLAKEYKTNISLAKGIPAYMAVLFGRAEKIELQLAKLAKALKRKQAVLESMIAMGQPGEMIEGYRIDEVGAAQSKIRDKETELGWAKRDLELLASPEGAARAAAFGKRVRRWLRSVRQTYGD
ncbi:MAG: hypothetical protein AAB320_00120 [Elusimicrobiota bacterium]